MEAGQTPRIAPGGREQIGLLNYGVAKLMGLATGGPPPNVFTTLARNRGLFRRWLWFAGGLMPGGKLPRRDTELVILRVAHNTGCDYEWGHHEHLGRRAGLSAEEVQRVREGAAAPGWTSRQQMLLRAADELHGEGRIGEALWAELSAELDDRRLIELCLLIGHYEMLAMTLNTLQVQPDPAPIGRRLPRWLSKA
ncbi:MAG TPA: carboxymuconolactone decarboxylase family protein [Solirubrobacterales bacterium]|nr:carboxymuconolactone decarboxylase family protein [Solirubrobacterales bacterium]